MPFDINRDVLNLDYKEELKKDNALLKDHFNIDPEVLKIRKLARKKIKKALRKNGTLDWSKLPSIITNNPKLIKSGKYNIISDGIMFAPSHWSGYNLCAFATSGCGMHCLTTSGHGQMHMKNAGTHHVHVARVTRSILYMEYRQQFFAKLLREIPNRIKKVAKDHPNENPTYSIRPNTTSDLRWEKIKIKDGKTLFELFPEIQFYDYTKDINRDISHIKNYHLTFSLSEKNKMLVPLAFKKGMNVAMVLRVKPEDIKPDTYTLEIMKGHSITKEAINGDLHDARFIDPENKFVVLSCKGSAFGDTSGFVQELN